MKKKVLTNLPVPIGKKKKDGNDMNDMNDNMKIFYCTITKLNYFLLGYHYNHSGYINVVKQYEKAKEIADKYSLDINTMEITEISKSRYYKNMIVMFSLERDQAPIEEAILIDNSLDYFYG